ncbi:MAG: class I SAM-dependent methyltransferase, partial [Dehalococcoidia bacterium]|nr:class I SAM-dependent methyltransferase [Dehalococcoidia bacterium]
MSRFTELSTELHFRAVQGCGGPVLDVGCGDGSSVARHLGASSVSSMIGLDGYGPACAAARRSGLTVLQADLERRWPIDDGSVDAVSANQVIEHVTETDHFAQECYRVLRDGGIAVVSTENLAAWPNIASLLIGQEPFSNNYSKRQWAIGNRLSRRCGPLPPEVAAYPHRSVGSYQAVADLFVHHGFRHAGSLGVHPAPLPAPLLRLLRRVDVRHAMYIT